MSLKTVVVSACAIAGVFAFGSTGASAMPGSLVPTLQTDQPGLTLVTSRHRHHHHRRYNRRHYGYGYGGGYGNGPAGPGGIGYSNGYGYDQYGYPKNSPRRPYGGRTAITAPPGTAAAAEQGQQRHDFCEYAPSRCP